MPPEGVDNQPPPAPECHYQCEVCNNAVFSTFKECADHEEECAKTNKKTEDPGDGEEKAPQPSPNTQKKEEKEQRDAVEAVLRLKTGTEGSEA